MNPARERPAKAAEPSRLLDEREGVALLLREYARRTRPADEGEAWRRSVARTDRARGGPRLLFSAALVSGLLATFVGAWHLVETPHDHLAPGGAGGSAGAAGAPAGIGGTRGSGGQAIPRGPAWGGAQAG